MNTTKITLFFYLFLGITFFTLIFYVDSTFDRSSLPDILPSTLNYIETVEYVSLERNDIYFLLTDVERYPVVLPRNILSVEIIEKTQDTIIAKEQIFERGITTILLVKHTMSPKFNHTIEIIDGPAKGTIMNQFFEEIDSGTKITTSLKFKFEGILTPLKFIPKQNAAHAIGTIISTFEAYGTISDNYNHRIIDNLYREILLRPTDPEGLQYFGSLLESGQITVDEIRVQLINSDERKYLLLPQDFKTIETLSADTIILINSQYDEILLRPTDPEGLQYFGSLLESGQITVDEIRVQLINSDERKLYEKDLLKEKIKILFSLKNFSDAPFGEEFNSLEPVQIKNIENLNSKTIESLDLIFQEILLHNTDDTSLQYFGLLIEHEKISINDVKQILKQLTLDTDKR
jgi:ribosome-associated toxin RatA of RatAB toxin-antitoxin module